MTYPRVQEVAPRCAVDMDGRNTLFDHIVSMIRIRGPKGEKASN